MKKVGNLRPWCYSVLGKIGGLKYGVRDEYCRHGKADKVRLLHPIVFIISLIALILTIPLIIILLLVEFAKATWEFVCDVPSALRDFFKNFVWW